MSSWDDQPGCITIPIGLLVLWLAIVVAGVGGHLVFLGLEIASLPFRRLGAPSPVVAWAVTGALLGGLMGLIVGLRRSGRRRLWREILGAVAVALLLGYVGARIAGLV